MKSPLCGHYLNITHAGKSAVNSLCSIQVLAVAMQLSTTLTPH